MTECLEKKTHARKLFILGIWGNSDSGKTRMVEQLIPLLKELRFRVGTIKHASHCLDLDEKGKDSHRHAMAGAEQVLLLGLHSAAFFVHENVREEIPDWLFLFEGKVDILLVEGFKKTQMPHLTIQIVEEQSFSIKSNLNSRPESWFLSRPKTHTARFDFPVNILKQLAAEIASVALSAKK